jgi:two-component system nitrate/nitrite response regulator NarL
VEDSFPRVLIVDDHEVLTEALALALRLEGFDHVAVAGDFTTEGVLEAAEKAEADIVLLDLHLGGSGSSVPLIAPLVAWGVRVLILTAEQAPHLLAECLEAGAAGLFDKVQPFDHLAHLIRDVAQGRTVLEPTARAQLVGALRQHRAEETARLEAFSHLTARENDVLRLLLDGRSADEIAAARSVSMSTVRGHIRLILQKLGVNSQLAAVVLAHRAGWGTEPP